MKGRTVVKAIRAWGIHSQLRHLPGRWTLVLVLVLAGNILYGTFHASDYGQSWDDPGDASFGQRTLRAYGGSTGFRHSGVLRYYGPAYFMLAGGASSLLHRIVPIWRPVDVRHVLNFLMLEVAVLAFYGLARRLMSSGPAVVSTLLFQYQPVIFGHGFINGKDLPFMAAFTVAAALGVRLVQRSGGSMMGTGSPGALRGWKAFDRGWRFLPWTSRAMFILVAACGLGIGADLFSGHMLLDLGTRALAAAYDGRGWGPLNALFAFVAEDAHKTSLDAYVSKLNGIYLWLRLVGVYLSVLPAVMFGLSISRRGEPPGVAQKGHGMTILGAAVALGIAISIRVAAGLAGALVTVVALARSGRRSLSTLLWYWTLALSVSYLTWPFLWDAPLQRVLQSIGRTTQFTGAFVLFRGQSFTSGSLPWDYLPTLMAIQLTEPTILLLVVGLFMIWPLFRDRRGDWWILGLALAWILVPFLASIGLRWPLYGNFRHVLFALPPLFLLAGFGIEYLWGKARIPLLKVGLAAIVVGPGIAGIIRLQPYEYIYYNVIVGGVKGVEGLFPHDYWCTSYRDAIEYVNANAPFGARVAISEPFDVAAPFARPDLDLVRTPDDPDALYSLRCNDRGGLTLRNLEGYPVAYTVSRSGVVLSVVFQREVRPAENR